MPKVFSICSIEGVKCTAVFGSRIRWLCNDLPRRRDFPFWSGLRVTNETHQINCSPTASSMDGLRLSLGTRKLRPWGHTCWNKVVFNVVDLQLTPKLWVKSGEKTLFNQWPLGHPFHFVGTANNLCDQMNWLDWLWWQDKAIKSS